MNQEDNITNNQESKIKEEKKNYMPAATSLVAGITTGWSIEEIAQTYNQDPLHAKKLAWASAAVYLTSVGATYFLKKNAAKKLTERMQKTAEEYFQSSK